MAVDAECDNADCLHFAEHFSDAACGERGQLEIRADESSEAILMLNI